jgi:hypothetical protein
MGLLSKLLSLFLAWTVVVATSPGAVITIRGPVLAPAAGGGPTTLATDDFNRADENPLTATNWTTGTSEDNWKIVSNVSVPSQHRRGLHFFLERARLGK